MESLVENGRSWRVSKLEGIFGRRTFHPMGNWILKHLITGLRNIVVLKLCHQSTFRQKQSRRNLLKLGQTKPWICNSPYQNLTARLSELDAASEQVALSKLDNKKMQDLFILWALDLEDMCLVLWVQTYLSKDIGEFKKLATFRASVPEVRTDYETPRRVPDFVIRFDHMF